MSRHKAASTKNNTREILQSGTATFCLELDILGELTCFDIKVADRPARLSDIVPLARTIATKLAVETLNRLGATGRYVPCRRGCSACCSYLVPLAAPEAFRLAEELSAMPTDKSGTLVQSCLNTAKIILDHMPGDSVTAELTDADYSIRSQRLSVWYAGLGLPCPFLSDSLCVNYEQRPIACREHMVTSSAASCDTASTREPDVVKMPVSALECLSQLTAELEQSDVEAVMLPLALPWAQENIERSRRTWPAATVVERFVAILQATAESSALTAGTVQPGVR